MPQDSNSKDEAPAAIFSPKDELNIDVPLGTRQHNNSDLHLIGETLPEPSIVSQFNSVGTVGQSPNPAREDHAHSLPDGSAASPPLGWGNTGFYKYATNVLGLAIGGVATYQWDANRFYAPSSMSIGAWSSNGAYGAVAGLHGYLLLGSSAPDTAVYLRANGQLNLGATGYADRVTITGSSVVITPTISCNNIGAAGITGTVISSSGSLNASTDVNVAGEIYNSGWFRSNNTNKGWYSTPNGVGIYAADTDWVRSYGSAIGFYGTSGGGHAGSAATGSLTGWAYMVRSNAYGSYAIFTSSRKIKKNIKTFDKSGEIIDSLRPVTFQERYKPEDDEVTKAWKDADLQFGFIAEEVAELEPFLVSYDENLDPMAWDISGVLTVAIAEIKSLRARVELLESNAQ